MKEQKHGLRIHFHGGAGQVTGSSSILRIKGTKNYVSSILIDSGVTLGEENSGTPTKEKVGAVFVTHAHVDHSGNIPRVLANNPDAPAYIPDGSKAVMGTMMHDAFKFEKKSEEIGIVNSSRALCRNYLWEIKKKEVELGKIKGKKSTRVNRKGRARKTSSTEAVSDHYVQLEDEIISYSALIQAKLGDAFPKNGDFTTADIERCIENHYQDEKKLMKERGIISQEDVNTAVQRLEERTLGKIHRVFPQGSEEVTFIMADSGHMITAPAVQLLISARGKNIVFSGDRGNEQLPAPYGAPDDTKFINRADFLILESTYGGREHPNRQSELAKMDELIINAIKNKVDIVIPIISLDRPLIVLYEIITRLFDTEIINPENVDILYFGNLLEKLLGFVPKNHPMWKAIKKYIKPLLKDGLNSLDKKGDKPRIILAGGGFLPTEGSPAGAVLEKMLQQDELTILFTNYFGRERSNAGNLMGGRPFFLTRDNQEPHELKPGQKANYISGFSGHAGTGQLVNYAAKVIRKNGIIYLNHGTDKARMALKISLEEDPRIKEKRIKIIIPQQGKDYVLKNNPQRK